MLERALRHAEAYLASLPEPPGRRAGRPGRAARGARARRCPTTASRPSR